MQEAHTLKIICKLNLEHVNLVSCQATCTMESELYCSLKANALRLMYLIVPELTGSSM